VIGIGVGTSVRYDWHSRYYYPYYRAGFWYGPYAYDYYPRYYAVYGAGDANVFWDWPDNGQVHLVLVYLRNPMGEGPAGAPLGPPPPTTTGPAAGPATRPADAGPAPGGPPATFGHEFTFVMKKV
jgi:hypothetical protein